MSLPNREAVVYFVLADPDAAPKGAINLDPGTIVDDYHTPNPPPLSPPPPASQQNFYSYQVWFPNYPDELIVKVPPYGWIFGDNRISIGQGGATAEAHLVYPANAKTEYNPGPPLYPGGPSYETVPNPNGTTENDYADLGDPLTITSIDPRWHTATAFDYSSSTGSPSPYSFFSQQGIVPEKGKVYQLLVGGIGEPSSDFVGSFDIQVTNLLSPVLNQQTNTMEYYPYSQATTEFKQTGKYVIPDLFQICCWNKGTVVKGKVAIYSVNVITGTLPASGYGWLGMTAEIGTTFAPVSEVAWEVTIDDGYTPVEITIPQVSGKATFVNDFWVTEVTPPV
jgi:hypothetical protein